MADLESAISSQANVSRFRDVDALDLDAQRKAYANQRYKSDTHDRRWLAEWVVALVSLWLLFVLLIIVKKDALNLSDTVLVALLGTTTLNIIGLSAIVLRGHFKTDKGDSDQL